MTAAPISPSRVERISEILAARNIAIVGIILGLLGAFFTLPPRAGALGDCAAAARDARGGMRHLGGLADVNRPGWGAIAAGVFGITLGLLDLQSSTTHLKDVFTWGTLLRGDPPLRDAAHLRRPRRPRSPSGAAS